MVLYLLEYCALLRINVEIREEKICKVIQHYQPYCLSYNVTLPTMMNLHIDRIYCLTVIINLHNE